MDLKKIVCKITSFLSYITPELRVISFCSYPDYSDNPYAVFLKMKQDIRFRKYKFVWMLNQMDKYNDKRISILAEYPDVKVVAKSSLSGFYFMLVSRYHICSHGLNKHQIFHQKKPKIINLWHGMPLKVIGALDPVYGATFENSDIVLATNDFYQEIMSRAFLVDRERVKVLGYPRNDLFDEPTDFFEKYQIDIAKYKSIGAWLPTFHKNVYTENRVDGHFKEGMIGFFDFDLLHKLDSKLNDIAGLLIIKLHPMDALNYTKFPQFTNIKVVTSNDPSFQLYPLLGKCDYLLTDFSSVFVDYDILKRPMGFVFNDLDSYKNNRGFIVDDVESFLPGNIISNYEEFVDFIVHYKERYINTGNRYNTYKDKKSSGRLLDYLIQQL